jgi:two-component system, sensor histidine kinase RegB
MNIKALDTGALRAFMRLLCTLRSVGVAGQAITIFIVSRAMGVDLPQTPLWAGVCFLAAFNAYATWRAAQPRDASHRELFGHLLVDIVVLAWQIGWSGGLENPFSSLFLLPIALSILALPTRFIWATAAASLLGFGLSVFFGRALPHVHGAMTDAFSLHKAGMLVNFLVSAAVMLVFFARLAALWREREKEVATLRERFTRNEGIVALATHAASVAHELNTPLATLTIMVDDLAESPGQPVTLEDADTMRMLIDQCRDRVRALAAPAHEGAADALVNLEGVIDRWLLVRPTIDLVRSGSIAGHERVDASVGHLLQALLNNAADASEQAGVAKVALHLEVRDGTLNGEIRDYGPGFGDTVPVLPATLFRTNKPQGLGVGLALSHATVERLGGELSMRAASDGRGVSVIFRLPARESA